MENFQSFLRNAICEMFHIQFENNLIEIDEFVCSMAAWLTLKYLYTKRRLN